MPVPIQGILSAFFLFWHDNDMTTKWYPLFKSKTMQFSCLIICNHTLSRCTRILLDKLHFFSKKVRVVWIAKFAIRIWPIKNHIQLWQGLVVTGSDVNNTLSIDYRIWCTVASYPAPSCERNELDIELTLYYFTISGKTECKRKHW